MLIKMKLEQSEEIIENKEELVTQWNSVDWNNNK